MIALQAGIVLLNAVLAVGAFSNARNRVFRKTWFAIGILCVAACAINTMVLVIKLKT